MKKRKNAAASSVIRGRRGAGHPTCRQAEWEPYTFQYAPLTIEQGKLTDPLYFDFISYVQFQTVARALPNAAAVFEERSAGRGTRTLLIRSRSYLSVKLRSTPSFADVIVKGSRSPLLLPFIHL